MAPRLHHSNRFHGWLGVLGFVAALELLTRTDLVPRRDFPPPSQTALTLAEVLGEEAFWSDLGSTLCGWAAGLALAAAIAVPLGVALGTNPLLYRSLRIPIEFLRPIPAVALVPIVVLMTGAGFESKLFLATFAATWPILIQTVYGMQDADPIARETARAFQVGRMDRLARVTLPGAMPYVATGLRLASAVALTLAVTAEIVIGVGGLGRSIGLASEGGDVKRMYALIAVTGIVGWSLNAVLAGVERRVLHWHATVRRTGVTA